MDIFDFGTSWLRIDFHLHTEQDREFKYNGDNFHDDYIDQLMKENIRIGIVTNHNKFNNYEFKQLSKRARKKYIFLIPGVELTVKEGKNGLHTLIAFKEEEWLKNGNDDINNFLNQVFTGIDNRESENTRCNEDLFNTIKKLQKFDKDFFIIFAHIEQKSGFITELGGGLIESLSKKSEFRKNIYGFQKLKTRDNIKKLKDWMGYELAFVEGSDPKNINEIGKGKECYIKLGKYSFDAVKLALRDYNSRICKEIKTSNHGYIKSIEFIGGKLDNKIINLSSELNTLIGIRGSGKSSILEVLRYGLNLEVGTDKKYKDDLIENTLSSGGMIILDIIDKYGRNYKVKKILNETLSIIDDTGKDVAISINTIINNPLYFGQKDLSHTEDGYEINLLDKLLGNGLEDLEKEIMDKENELMNEISNWIEIRDIDSRIEDLISKNKDLTHKLEIYDEKGITEKLKKQTTYNKDKIHIEKVKEELTNSNNSIIEIANADIVKECNELKGFLSEYNSIIFESIDISIDQYISLLKDIIKTQEKLEVTIEDIEKLNEQLAVETKDLREEFAKIKREIKIPNLNADNYIEFTATIENNNNKIQELEKSKSGKEKYESNIRKHIRERNEILLREFKVYQDVIYEINTGQEELKIDARFKGNKEEFKQLLKLKFTGTKISEMKYQNLTKIFTDFITIFEDINFENGKKIKEILTEREYEAFKEKFEQNMTDIIQSKVPNKIDILYHNKPLHKHSLGQRASALVLFILTQEDNDLIIIDQPEDDLDNQVIYKELINAIKIKKPNIQFVFATHNANIPVLGDSEQIIATDYNDIEININCGSIDMPEMQTKIVDIMEGGPEAFKRRNGIYKLWKVNN